MKILFFLPTHTLTIERGDTTHIKELVSNLSKLAEIDFIKANDVRASHRVLIITKTLRVMRGFIKAVFLIRKRRPDIIYTRGSECILTIPLAKLFGLPMIAEINGLALDEWRMERPSGINGWISYIKGLLNEKTYKYADHLVVVTNKIKKVMESEYKINPEKISVIENGANTELFRPMNTKEARRELKLNETYNYICFTGALYQWQGVEYLIKASSYILEEYPNTFFLIVGDGPARESLTNLAEQLGVSDRFIFTGVKPYTSIPLYINASDLCVAPCIKERNSRVGFSALKAYESLACGKPVIASDIEGVRELLTESKSGICVPAESPRELANAVVGLLRDPKTGQSMGENGRRHIVENRSWESVARKVLEVCQMVVQKHMKILFFLPTHTLTIERGDTTHIKELVSNLSKLAEIVVIKANDVIAPYRVFFMTKTLRVIRGFTKAVFLIRKKRPDIIYTRGGQCIFTIPLAKLFRLPVIVEINGLFLDEWRMEGGLSGINGWTSYIKGLLNEKTYKYADHLVVVTNKIKKVLQIEYKINPEKMSVIENGANTELFRPMNTKKARRELKLNETYNYICYAGSLYQWQGVKYLIKASPYILEKCPQSVFLVIGDGPSRESLTDLAEQLGVSDRFIFTGAKPYTSVPLYINASDLCVAPFIKERNTRLGFSALKVYEYLACGKPVVASDIEEVWELLEESNAGICVPAESPRELASAVVGLLRDPKTRQSMGENGRRHVVENCSWESVARKVFEVCQLVVRKH